ncbi:MAG: SAM-dependent chlorinase/fluorinase [Bacteroidota bacterium]|nr:SAM-dependent chlorinase/fluorinase [Bacteroidota bacterium]
MSIISITSDYGEKDFNKGFFKGLLHSELKNPTVIDITHEVSPFNIVEASYIIKNCYKSFPRGSIHIIDVDSAKNPEQELIVVDYDNHFFITANNGLMSLFSEELKPNKVIEINFNGSKKEIFSKVASHIYRGGNINLVGNELNELKTLKDLKVRIKSSNQIIGNVIYIDNYGNIVTNITKLFFEEFQNGRNFEINARNILFDKVFDSYIEAINFSIEKKYREEDGKKIAIFNSCGYLEIGIYKSNPKTVGSAQTLFGLNYGDLISVQFF